ncbi:MAG: hypothetical protein N3E46_09275 [Gemmataceae bacterium]|jgi:uncharacterized membrane protein|uniref:Uncharacterized protein n=1 Tax=Thermogemmata fonticola TaxID=2755323 RepID=A0A7V9AB39_9BACT|nr:hypothetical protein [Thermogemmata fonticola]MBA2225816.1 hypothetical protein [Thermogemmata fonticola]MCX8139860.1 hypothetical protein [Gemmataceae bacterium]
MMALPTVITGLLLILVGLVGYFGAEPNPQTGKVSPTALIPAAFGIVLVILGGLAFSDKLRKHAMHLAALVGVLGVIGGFMPILRQINNTGTFDPFKKSAVAGELMILICAVFVGLCVRSFVLARLSRQAKNTSQSDLTPSA